MVSSCSSLLISENVLPSFLSFCWASEFLEWSFVLSKSYQGPSLCPSKAEATLEADEAELCDWNIIQSFVQYLGTAPVT